MALSESQRSQIISYSGKMTADEIASKVGVGRATVFRVLRDKDSIKTVSKSLDLPAPAHAHDIEEHSIKTVSKVSKSLDEIDTALSPELIAKVALTHLLSEISLYDEALAEKSSEDEKVRSMAEWKVVNHEKLVQSALRIVAQWFGMDKGDVLKAIEDIRHDPFATMTKEELLKLYEVTG